MFYVQFNFDGLIDVIVIHNMYYGIWTNGRVQWTEGFPQKNNALQIQSLV